MSQKIGDKPTATSGGVKVYHIVRGNLIEEKTMQFNDGDTYVIDNGLEIYVWLGKDSSVDEDFAGAWAAEQLDLSRRGAPRLLLSIRGRSPRNSWIY